MKILMTIPVLLMAFSFGAFGEGLQSPNMVQIISFQKFDTNQFILAIDGSNLAYIRVPTPNGGAHEMYFKEDGANSSNLPALTKFISLLSQGRISKIKDGKSIYFDTGCFEITGHQLVQTGPRSFISGAMIKRAVLGKSLEKHDISLTGPNECSLD